MKRGLTGAAFYMRMTGDRAADPAGPSKNPLRLLTGKAQEPSLAIASAAAGL